MYLRHYRYFGHDHNHNSSTHEAELSAVVVAVRESVQAPVAAV